MPKPPFEPTPDSDIQAAAERGAGLRDGDRQITITIGDGRNIVQKSGTLEFPNSYEGVREFLTSLARDAHNEYVTKHVHLTNQN